MATNIVLKRSASAGAAPGTGDLELGELALNTYDGKLYMKKTVSGSSSIVNLSGGTAATSSAFAHTTYKYTATSSQTTFTGSDANSVTLVYTAGQIQVFLNGILLDAADYTASNGTSVVLGSGASTGSILLITSFEGTNPFDYFKYTATNAQTTFTGNDANSESLIYTVGNIAVYLNGVLLDATDYTATSGTSVVLASGATTGDILTIWEFNEGALTDVANDTSPQLGADLDVVTYDIVSTSNRNIDIVPNGTGNVTLQTDTLQLGSSGENVTVTTNGTGDVTLNTNSGTNSGSIVIADGANANITLTPNGTGIISLVGDVTIADGSNDFDIASHDGTNGLKLAGTVVTTTAAELNIVDGSTSATGTTLAAADRLLVNDNGTMVQVALSDFETFFESAIDTFSTIDINGGSIDGATVGANSASSGAFTTLSASGALTGTLGTAAQTNVTSLGTLTALTVDDINLDGKVVTMTGSSSDTAVFTAGTNGTLSIVTTDAAAAAANIQITADGTVDIDSAGVLTLDSGAAINIEPASGSAILLDGTISIDAGVVTGATSITLSGELDAGSLDISGNADIDGTLETDNLTIGSAQGSDGQVLTSTGSGVGWEDAGGGAVSAINNATANELVTIGSTTTELDAEANLTFDGSGTLAISGAPAGIHNTSNGNNIDIKTTSGGSLVHAVKIHSGGLFEAKQGAVFNEDSADVDFRVESNGSTHMLFVDAGNDRVGIGMTTALGQTLEVNGDIQLGNGRSDNVEKHAIYFGTPYDTGGTSPIMGMYLNGHSSGNFITIGGGTGSSSAATSIAFNTTGLTTGAYEGTEAMRIDSSGRLSIGVTSGAVNPLHVEATDNTAAKFRRSTSSTTTGLGDPAIVEYSTGGDMADGFGVVLGFSIRDSATTSNNIAFIGATRAGADNTGDLIFHTYASGSQSEKMRITSTGHIFIAKTGNNYATVGHEFHSGGLATHTRNSDPCLLVNRGTNDGTVILIRQANSDEGNIAVSGSTVSYNGFSGRHESSGIADNVAIGTVVSTIDNLDTYLSGTKSGQTRADHAKIKVSDTSGDSRVYGVLASYSETDNKPIVASVGIGSVRVIGACAGGDLLESNGDGTAKVQDDDIIRSKTIGKATIGNTDTGVKLVSCVLYC